MPMTRPWASIWDEPVEVRLDPSRRIGIGKLMELGTVSPDLLSYIWIALEAGMNMVVFGAAYSGKTTVVRNLLYMLSKSDRVVIVGESLGESGPGKQLYKRGDCERNKRLQ